LWGHCLKELAFSSVPLDAWLTFKNLPLIPVRILACQDAGRYPCFASVSPDQIAEYRSVLLEAMSALGLDEDFLCLINYSDIKMKAEKGKNKKGSEIYFYDRLNTLEKSINSVLSDIWVANGRDQFQDELKRIDPTGAVAPLFEPLLISLEHPEIPMIACQSNTDPDRLYFDIMQNIYRPSVNESHEQLRRLIIRNSLLGSALYCAAYEANTGSKNPDGFDDVATMFPNALRMSIHQKDEAIGHFSIHVSPTANRTPWHGSAYLTAACRSGVIQISIELAGLVELAGARRVIPKGHARGIFARHVNISQPIAFLAPTLTVSSSEDLLDLFSNNCLTANG
ncbi:L-tyrosine/L-tryptophan isonitrile synthase family protein, partial [Aureimonas ureilytica]|uniref:L-tyrosine/L-tryptophan isonitrile synthase family protein n=1 Tax=Aureimonas ureilytica TaxID=401562 RepID=UPI000B1C3471